MKIKFIITLFFLVCFSSFCSLLNASTWIIDQTGGGNFLTIQEGINACSNSDTVLVHPGTYYENLSISNTFITLASLYLTTGDESYIHQTVIDGFYNGSVIHIEFVETDEVFICGFTIEHGSGFQYSFFSTGGGIYCVEANIKLKKCIIKNNRSFSGGGGISLENSQLYLIGNTITNNLALSIGGGIVAYYDSDIVYDENILNNIYLNFAGKGNDIAFNISCPFQEIIVDIFTIVDTGMYYIFAYDDYGYYIPGEFSIDLLHTKIEPENADLFVSPDGDNNNSGLTSEEPLQSIAFALAKIVSDSLHHNTIHVPDGIYAPGLNGQHFPLHLKSYVSVIGESRENTILDAEQIGGHIAANDPQYDYTIKNMTFKNGYNQREVMMQLNKKVILDSLIVTNYSHSGEFYYHKLFSIYFSDFVLKNTIVTNNYTVGALNCYSGLVDGNCYPYNYVINCKITNNEPVITGGTPFSIARAHPDGDSLIVNIINTEITDNVDISYDWFPSTAAIHVTGAGEAVVNVVNCTIGNNETTTGAAVVLQDTSTMNIYNSILYGDVPREIFLDADYYDINTLTVSNSLVEGGFWNIGLNGNNIVNWLDGNLDEDPCWDVMGDNPYALMEDSPCIDAGTLDLPPGIELPEYDLAGNPRIVNGMIDMGAYEWQDSVSVKEDIFKPITQTKISSYPNPFNPTTTIKLDHAESGKIELAIYNIKGQKIKTLMDAYSCKGHFEIIWRGTDENEKKVATGNYFAKLKVNGDIKAVRKLILLK